MGTISRCLVLGNSPSALQVTGEELVSFGVNRIGRTHKVDFTVVVDQKILDEEKSFGGSTLLTWDKCVAPEWGCSGAEHRLMSFRIHEKYFDRPFPNDIGDPLVRGGCTPAYALQLAVLAGFHEIGLIGVDFNANLLGAASHCYGDGKSEGSTGCGEFTPRYQEFFRDFYAWATSKGVWVYNLGDPDSPFGQLSGLPKKSAADYLRRD